MVRWRERRMYRLLDKAAREREAFHTEQRTQLDQLDPLVLELVRIGDREHYLNSDRAREIGMLLNRRGGMSAMVAAHEQVSHWHPDKARALEMAWDRIGDWLG